MDYSFWDASTYITDDVCTDSEHEQHTSELTALPVNNLPTRHNRRCSSMDEHIMTNSVSILPNGTMSSESIYNLESTNSEVVPDSLIMAGRGSKSIHEEDVNNIGNNNASFSNTNSSNMYDIKHDSGVQPNN